MDTPREVLIHNELAGMKATRGRLLAISASGYYEVNCRFGEKSHRVLLPIANTVLIAETAEEVSGESIEIER